MHRFDKKKYAYAVLVGILITVVLIIFAFYGFSNFLNGIEDNDMVALLLVIIIVGIILVMLQRAGIIFADRQL